MDIEGQLSKAIQDTLAMECVPQELIPAEDTTPDILEFIRCEAHNRFGAQEQYELVMAAGKEEARRAHAQFLRLVRDLAHPTFRDCYLALERLGDANPILALHCAIGERIAGILKEKDPSLGSGLFSAFGTSIWIDPDYETDDPELESLNSYVREHIEDIAHGKT